MNEIDKSAIFGGYIRDMYLGLTPSDADIVSNIPIETIEDLFGKMEKAQKRKTVSGHDVFSFKMHRREKIFIEIVSTTKNIMEKSKEADYTINSLLYDGIKVIDELNGLNDLKKGVIREVDINIIQKDLSTRPYLWLKTLRLMSMTDFEVTKEVVNALRDNVETIKEIEKTVFQTEGHKSLNGKNPFKVMELLKELGFVSDFDASIEFEKKEYPLSQEQKLCLMAIYSNKKAVDDYIAFYQMSETLKEKYEEIYEGYFSEQKLKNRLKNKVLTLKKIIEK